MDFDYSVLLNKTPPGQLFFFALYVDVSVLGGRFPGHGRLDTIMLKSM